MLCFYYTLLQCSAQSAFYSDGASKILWMCQGLVRINDDDIGIR